MDIRLKYTYMMKLLEFTLSIIRVFNTFKVCNYVECETTTRVKALGASVTITEKLIIPLCLREACGDTTSLSFYPSDGVNPSHLS